VNIFRPILGARVSVPALLLFCISRTVAVCTGLLCVIVTSSPAAEARSAQALRWVSNSAVAGQWILEVTGANAQALAELGRAKWTPAQWQKLLVVHAEQGDALGSVGLPPMHGTYRVETNRIQFEPLFPLEPGVKYVTAFFADRMPGPRTGGGPLVSTIFELPRAFAAPSGVVKQIYPSAGVLPENLLKFYVHFSAPMSRGHIYDHIHLRNETGKDVELPFLEIDEELWNPQMTRLTLFIDPGRIKRGVQPLEEIGPALEEGRRYTLIIDAQWQDGHGTPLKKSFEKVFLVGPPDREAVQPARWKIQPPTSATREPLRIQFGESMDHALASRVIHIIDDSGHGVDGRVELEDHERRWSFLPAQPWRRAAHSVLVQNTIEDLAGNNVGKAFEVDLFEGIQRRFTNTTIRLPFEVR
jgi:hypothetical protein